MWLNPQFPADLVTFTEEILNGKLHFLCSGSTLSYQWKSQIFGLNVLVYCYTANQYSKITSIFQIFQTKVLALNINKTRITNENVEIIVESKVTMNQITTM